MSQQNETQKTAANYIQTFYQEVQNLTHRHSQYINLLAELNNKYGTTAIEKITEEERKTLIELVQYVRYHATTTYIYQQTINKQTNTTQDKNTVKDLYDKIKTRFIPTKEDVETYTILLNTYLLNEIMQELLEKSSDILTKIYDK